MYVAGPTTEIASGIRERSDTVLDGAVYCGGPAIGLGGSLEVSKEPKNKCTPLVWPARTITASTPRTSDKTTTTPRPRPHLTITAGKLTVFKSSLINDGDFSSPTTATYRIVSETWILADEDVATFTAGAHSCPELMRPLLRSTLHANHLVSNTSGLPQFRASLSVKLGGQ